MKILSKLVKEDNFLSLSGNLAIAVFGFLGFALLARSQTPNEFAKWVLFISGGSLVEMLRYGITNNALVRFLSAANDDSRDELIGSNALISLIATLVLVLFLLLIKIIFKSSIDASSYNLFFQWYPLLAIVNLPLNNAVVVQQAKMDYGIILIIRALNSALFFVFLMMNFFYFGFGLRTIVFVFIGCNLITSAICMFKSWDGFSLIKRANRVQLKTLLNFGKYSTFTLIGTNLLRNSDILILSVSPFGSAAVALFSIPLKLTEIQQIPLRSFVATAFPKMSKASLEGDISALKSLFNTYSGVLTYLFFFGSLVTRKKKNKYKHT
jgi:O-antigen/teichoic acid export membrane protein